MLNDQLDGITPFLAVAELKSFTEAAVRLGVTPTAVSKAIRVLERRYGVVLFQRTTRRVALTEAGDSLYRQMRPAVADMLAAIETLEHYRHRPQGTLRVTAPRNNTADYLFNAIVPRFRQAYPEVMLDISLDDGLVDIVAEGYDAGIRLGESVEGDMAAVRLTPEITWSVVATPAYFTRAGRPVIPEDLVSHEAIRYRFVTSRAMHRWAFRSGRRDFVVDAKGGIIVNDRNLLIEFALKGLGLAFVSDYEVRHHIAAGRLESVLREYIPADSGVFLYFPQRSQTQPKLRAFIDMAKEVASQPGFLDRFRQ
ncbi:LysR family transcriptional regulator [Sodalis sp. dw_96]|uniref:LysR family transcriptional regulator n=1 Tax=Sodalis sp. dw_96 TaxID=2719794 RepID=UPI001BD34D2E|nr:LysR family transcriptional regulator [Sodalis sp. dw_96]